MKSRYSDITSRIADSPKWYDINGTPRYDIFHPKLSPNIYAKQVVLMEISCQHCQKRFFVEMNWGMPEQLDEYMKFGKHLERFEERIHHLHYGDPPNHHCTGDSMNCEDLRIVEFWNNEDFKWKRLEQHEVTIQRW